MLDTISQYIDPELLLIIVVALVSFIVLKFIFKKISMPKIIQIILVILVISGNIYFIYSYIDTAESEYIDTKKEYYIKGKVGFVSNAIDKIRIDYTDTNMIIEDLDTKQVLVNISSSTLIYDRNGNKITLDEIKSGDYVVVKTSTHTLSGGTREFKANKIQKY